MAKNTNNISSGGSSNCVLFIKLLLPPATQRTMSSVETWNSVCKYYHSRNNISLVVNDDDDDIHHDDDDDNDDDDDDKRRRRMTMIMD